MLIARSSMFAMALLLAGCGDGNDGQTLRIVSGSENEALEPVIQAWAQEHGHTIEMVFQGSVEISRCLERGAGCEFDAVWPANSLWIELGDRQGVVKHSASIFRSPVVLGLKCEIARELGWLGKTDLAMADISEAAERGAFRLGMTSATQSNSGASAYIGFLYAMAGNPDLLTMDNLDDPAVRAATQRLLGTVDRGSGSSGWLKESFVENPSYIDAMINYEAMIIEANRGWSEGDGTRIEGFLDKGEDPLCAVYPRDGLTVADSPLGYIGRGDAEQEAVFLALQEHLLASEAQDRMQSLGRRTGLIGLDVENADTSVFNPDWGIDLTASIAPSPTPPADVLRRAFDLYQTGLRKPSLTVWLLDVSGSMEGEGIKGLRAAMRNLLDQETAAQNLLQMGDRDITYVIPFNHQTGEVWQIEGNDPAELDALLKSTQQLDAGGGTDLYRALAEAIEILDGYYQEDRLWDYLAAIVAMTDGASSPDNKDYFLQRMNRSEFARDVPIHAIAFGDADREQLDELTTATVGRLFSSGDDLPGTLKKVKGYN